MLSLRGKKVKKTENNEKDALNIPDIVLPILVIAPFSSIASMRYNCFNASSNDSAAYYIGKEISQDISNLKNIKLNFRSI